MNRMEDKIKVYSMPEGVEYSDEGYLLLTFSKDEFIYLWKKGFNNE